MLAQLTFGQEIIKEIVGALATAGLVTVAGTLLVTRWTKETESRHSRELAEEADLRSREAAALQEERNRARDALEHRREDAQLAAEGRAADAAMRRELVSRVTTVASTMFIACQHARRQMTRPGADVTVIVAHLDDEYRTFAIANHALEAELGARFGVIGLTRDGAAVRPSRLPYGRWHQIGDLLTVYYFNLAAYETGRFPGDVLERNSTTGTAFHSGLDLRPDHEALRNGVDLERADIKTRLSDMRKAVRRAYQPALDDLVASIVVTPAAAPVLHDTGAVLAASD